jgi:hypothetical protein
MFTFSALKSICARPAFPKGLLIRQFERATDGCHQITSQSSILNVVAAVNGAALSCACASIAGIIVADIRVLLRKLLQNFMTTSEYRIITFY